MTDETKTVFECVVSAEMFKRAMAAVSKEERRYYLNGVHVAPCDAGGALLVATDGRRLVVLRDPHGYVPNGTGIVSLNAHVTRALTAKASCLPNWNGPLTGKGVPVRLLAVKGQKASVIELRREANSPVDGESIVPVVDNPGPETGGYQWCGALIDGTFPDWRRVVGEPAFDEAVTASFDPALLAPLAEALHGKNAHGGNSVRLVPSKNGGELGAHFVFSNAVSDGFAILMPVRQVEKPRMPDWYAPAATKIAAE